jgi:hypothetical protein
MSRLSGAGLTEQLKTQAIADLGLSEKQTADVTAVVDSAVSQARADDAAQVSLAARCLNLVKAGKITEDDLAALEAKE